MHYTALMCYVLVGTEYRCSEWDHADAFLPCYIAWCRVYTAHLWTNYFTYIMVRVRNTVYTACNKGRAYFAEFRKYLVQC